MALYRIRASLSSDSDWTAAFREELSLSASAVRPLIRVESASRFGDAEGVVLLVDGGVGASVLVNVLTCLDNLSIVGRIEGS